MAKTAFSPQSKLKRWYQNKFQVNVVTGAASGGFYKCAVVYARQYSHFVIATCQLLKCASLFMSPVLVAIFVHDAEKQSQWRIIFILAAVFMFLVSFKQSKHWFAFQINKNIL